MELISEREFENILPELRKKITLLFNNIDSNRNKNLDRKECSKFWKDNFPNINTIELFADVDKNDDEEISFEEWVSYWINIINAYGKQETENRVILRN